ncbi:RES family NAD+ phosphorylase [Arthrobacter sp. Z1-15]
MASADDFDPRILSEFRRYTTEEKPHDQKMRRFFGMPEDYDNVGFIKSDSADSQIQTDAPLRIRPPKGEVAWTGDEYLRKLELIDLRRRIQHYQKISDKLVDRPSIRRELHKALEVPGFAAIVIPFNHLAIPRETRLFRARKIDAPAEIQRFRDIWTAPPYSIGAGRLNDVGEPLLYTAVHPLTAVHEIHAGQGDLIALSEFKSSKRIMAVDMSSEATVQGLRKGDRRKLAIIMKFLVGNFSQKIPSGAPSRYMAPDLIAKELFNPYPDIYSGWWYKSIADPRNGAGQYNLALRASAAEDLVEYQQTQIIDVQALNESGDGAKVLATLKQIPGSDRLENAIS